MGMNRVLIDVISLHLPGGTEENYKNSSVRTASVPAEVLTEHLTNTNLQRCHYKKLAGNSCVTYTKI
jgi:hypothetical protein